MKLQKSQSGGFLGLWDLLGGLGVSMLRVLGSTRPGLVMTECVDVGSVARGERVGVVGIGGGGGGVAGVGGISDSVWGLGVAWVVGLALGVGECGGTYTTVLG